MSSSALRIYLQNHEAAARAGVDLCRRAAHNQREQAHGPVLADLCGQIVDDRRRLLAIMTSLQVPPNPLLGVVLQVGERVGRLKPNGRVLRRAPLSDLIEIEALIDAVSAKRAGWHGLAAASPRVPVTSQVAELITRADDQLASLRPLHATLAARVLT
ncbi:MAG TPA: hypothetical protein VFR88_01125 [Microlunatus sp.]|nr:hypothetical protein [Microlunatus sp.]